MMDFLARSASCPSVTCSHPVGVTLGKSLVSSEARLFCLYLYLSDDFLDSTVPPHTPRKATSVSRSHYFCGFSKHKWLLGGKETGRKKGSAKFDLHAKPRYSLIRKRDWRSGSALRSHRRGHWFEPSITHQRTPVSRNGGFIVSPPPAHPPQRLLNPADRSAAPPRERQPRHGPTTNEVPP